ncbi:MAG: anti-sigma F factor antagonist [Bacillota bacterium]|nr:anti-sigma F factor antagonist [Bacillota bacterium]
MDISSKISGNTLICYIRGELDHHTANEIREYIDYNLENNPVKNLIIDMSELSFMDSSGIGVLIGRYKKVTALGGKTAVVNENKQISKVLEVSGIYDIIFSFPSIQQALNEL